MQHVFVSYVMENKKTIYKLCKHLEKHGVTVWLDKNDIAPGTFWKDSIRGAISNGDFFMAFFSKEQNSRSRSYMNEELILAIEELRRRKYNQAWFIPILLSGEIPEMDIGAGKTLRDLQWIELNDKNWTNSSNRILKVISPITIKKSSIRYPDSIDQSMREALNIGLVSLAKNTQHVLRACVMLPTSDEELKVEYWSTNMFGDPVLDINLQKWQGPSGKAWGYGAGVVGDLSKSKNENGVDDWGLTDEQRVLMKSIATIMSIPIYDHKEKEKVIGILTFDSHEPLVDFFSEKETQQIAFSIAGFIGKLMEAYRH